MHFLLHSVPVLNTISGSSLPEMFVILQLQIVGRVLRSMQSQHGLACIEDHPEHLLEALTEALGLVGSVKCYDPLPQDS